MCSRMLASIPITTYHYRNYLYPFCQSRCGNLRLGPGYQPECKENQNAINFTNCGHHHHISLGLPPPPSLPLTIPSLPYPFLTCVISPLAREAMLKSVVSLSSTLAFFEGGASASRSSSVLRKRTENNKYQFYCSAWFSSQVYIMLANQM